MAKTTTVQQIPYPELTDKPDGATQMKSLAQKVDDLLSKGFTAVTGIIKSGDPNSGSSYGFQVDRNLGGFKIQTNLYNSALAADGLAISVVEDGVSKFVYVFDKAGQITAFTGDSSIARPIPFATFVGTGSVVLSNAASGTVAIPLPTTGGNRFTQAPYVVANAVAAAGNVYMCWVSAASATSVTIGIRHVDNALASATVSVQMIAIQMTPTSAPG